MQTSRMHCRTKKHAVVAGNAPSLAKIDYSRLPLEFDAFRCNQFYFEDKYYLGKDIKSVSFAEKMCFEQIYTSLILKDRKEYNIESVFLPNHYVIPQWEYELLVDQLAQIFCYDGFIRSMNTSEHLSQINVFLEYVKLQKLYFDKNPTSTIFLCAIAAAMGYEEIYLAGIDFYEGKTYAFDILHQNLLTLMPDFEGVVRPNGKHIGKYHTKEADLETLAFLEKQYGVRFYSLCPESPLSRHYPLAPITNNTFVPIEKSSGYTNDIAIPSRYAYEQYARFVRWGKDFYGDRDRGDGRIDPYRHERNYAQDKRFRDNVILKFFRDLLRLPSDIRDYLKQKMA